MREGEGEGGSDQGKVREGITKEETEGAIEVEGGKEGDMY